VAFRKEKGPRKETLSSKDQFRGGGGRKQLRILWKVRTMK
jgi:hypothetical protein